MNLNNQQERQNQIIQLLKEKKYVTTYELVQFLHFSESTIKRDLINLEKDGLIRRTRGGAIIIDNNKIDIPYLMKLTNINNDKVKQHLGSICEQLIQDDMVLFIDSSSTCLHLINILSKFKGLKIITNGLVTASVISEYIDADVIIIGGKIVKKRWTINGSSAIFDIEKYNADLAFISCRGYSIDNGATETTEGEAYIKQAFRRQAKEVVLVFDETKYNKNFMYQSLSNKDIDYVVTNASFDQDEKEALNYCGIKTIIS